MALAALLLAEAVNLLDSTIVQVAAPVMHARMGGSVSDIQWFSTAYTLPFALLLVTGGRLGDAFGRRRLLRIGVTTFAAASLACALAPSAGALIAFRVVQGAGAAVTIPQTIGLIKAMFRGPDLPKAFATIGPVMGLAAVCGPVSGAVLTHADLFGSSWRSAFVVNLPLCAVVLALSPLLLEDRAPRRPGLDPLGTALAMIGTALIVFPLTDAGSAPPTAADWGAVAAGPLVLAVFGLYQAGAASRGRRTLVETSLFHGRRFPAALATSTLYFAATTGLMLVIVLELQLGLSAGVLNAGLTLVPWSAGLAVASTAAGARLIPRYGHRMMPAGLTVLLLGLLAAVAVYRGADPGSYPWPLLPALAVAGLGVGLFSPTFFSVALEPVRPQQIGSAAGLLNAVQQLGATLGVAGLGSIYLRIARPGDHRSAQHAAEAAFWVGIGLAALSAATSALMRQRGPGGDETAAEHREPAAAHRSG